VLEERRREIAQQSAAMIAINRELLAVNSMSHVR
jgi:hypothetical protein